MIKEIAQEQIKDGENLPNIERWKNVLKLGDLIVLETNLNRNWSDQWDDYGQVAKVLEITEDGIRVQSVGGRHGPELGGAEFEWDSIEGIKIVAEDKVAVIKRQHELQLEGESEEWKSQLKSGDLITLKTNLSRNWSDQWDDYEEAAQIVKITDEGIRIRAFRGKHGPELGEAEFEWDAIDGIRRFEEDSSVLDLKEL